MPNTLTRREFLKIGTAAGAAAALPAVIPARVLGQDGKSAASERIALGFIGVGGMGNSNLFALMRRPEVEVVAVCDVYEPRLNETRAKVGEKCTAFRDFRKLLERKDIDAVVISTPDHWHAPIALTALQAGKDVYCEKPLTYTIQEGRELVKATRRYNRVFQVGSQQRSESNFRYACELVRSGKIGKLSTIKVGIGGGPQGGDPAIIDPPAGLDWDFYQGPAPEVPYQKGRFGFNFRWFSDYSGGILTDWGAHHLDIAQWASGFDGSGPVSVQGTGTYPTSGAYDTLMSFDIKYVYPDGVTVNCSSQNRHGITFEGDKGWIFVERGELEASDKDILTIELGAGDVHLEKSPGHHQNWLDCVKSRKKPICDVEVGHRSVTMCHLGNITCRIQRSVNWDPKTERILNDEEANRWLFRPYRAPWTI